MQRLGNRVIAQHLLVLPRRRWRRSEGRRATRRFRDRRSRRLPGSLQWRGRTPAPQRPAGAGRSTASSRASGMPVASRRAIVFSSRTATHSPSMIAPVQTPITPAMISVFPVLNSLIGIPKPIASRPATTRPIPATNIRKAIKPTLSRARNARQPPTPRYRHIERTANRQLHTGFRISTATLQDLQPASALCRSATVQTTLRIPTAYQLLPCLLHCIRDLGHNSQLLGNGTALYG